MFHLVLSIYSYFAIVISANAAGGMALSGLAYGQTTIKLSHRVGSNIETHARKIILRDRMSRKRVMPMVSGGAPIEDDYKVLSQADSKEDFLGDYGTIDPEYAQILSDIDRKHSLYKLTHRDLQWRMVAEVMKELDNDDRVELVKNVRRHPLHRRLPATIAISPRALNNWQVARSMFLDAIKE